MIGLLDCNNFFVSCERLFRPDLKNVPVAVLSSNDGCIVARSQEVKDIGIPMGVPYFKVREICEKEGIVLFSGNITLYRDISQRVMHTLGRFVSNYEVYSIDEAFFTLDARSPQKQALLVRGTIMREVGIPVSIGVADTKTIAKYASEKVKRSHIQTGVCMLAGDNWLSETQHISCGTIWGIGGRTAAKLSQHDIHTVADFLATDRHFIEKEFGVAGTRMQFELRGVKARSGHEDETRKSIMSTRSFEKEVRDLATLESAIAYHTTHIAGKLRERGTLATQLRVMINPSRYGDYALRTGSRDVMLSAPTADTKLLIHEALTLVRALYDPEVPYKRAGVSVYGIIVSECATQSMFETSVDSGENLSEVIDAINTRFGRDTLHSGIIQHRHRWSAQSNFRSPAYTTSWQDIVRAKAT